MAIYTVHMNCGEGLSSVTFQVYQFGSLITQFTLDEGDPQSTTNFTSTDAGNYVYVLSYTVKTGYAPPIKGYTNFRPNPWIIYEDGVWGDRTFTPTTQGTKTGYVIATKQQPSYSYSITLMSADGRTQLFHDSTSGTFETKSWNLGSIYTPTPPTGKRLYGWATTVGGNRHYLPDGQVLQEKGGSTTLYAMWVNATSLFTWKGSDTLDISFFKKDAAISAALTATNWNNYEDKISTLFSSSGASGTYSKVYVQPGDTITYSAFNHKRSGLVLIRQALGATSTVIIPQSVGSTTIIKYGLFNGVGSLKGALNELIIKNDLK